MEHAAPATGPKPVRTDRHRRRPALAAERVTEAPPEYSADPVELASDLSFPASDPPAWIFSGR